MNGGQDDDALRRIESALTRMEAAAVAAGDSTAERLGELQRMNDRLRAACTAALGEIDRLLAGGALAAGAVPSGASPADADHQDRTGHPDGTGE